MKYLPPVLFLLLALALPPRGYALPRLAVVVTKSPTLKPAETVSLENIVSRGFQDTGKYSIVDEETINNMLEDEVAEALLAGNESRLDEIQAKHQVDVLVSLSSSIESIVGVGGYSIASASVSVACRSPKTALVFDQQDSEPQNGYLGMPEWMGVTEEAARKVALQAAVASVFQRVSLATVEFPLPERLQLSFVPAAASTEDPAFMPKYAMSAEEAGQLTRIVEPSIGNREEIKCSVMDGGKRLAAVGITGIDIDLQRNRRLDTARLEIYDLRMKRSVRKLELPRDVPGVRRPRSRDIVDIAFAPTGRFLVMASLHPALWLYDNLNGEMLALTQLPDVPRKVSISQDGRVVKVECHGADVFYNLLK